MVEKKSEAVHTKAHGAAEAGPAEVRGFRLTVIDGPRKGLSYASDGAKCSIGSHESNDPEQRHGTRNAARGSDLTATQ